MIKIKNYEVIKAFGKRVRDLRTSQNLSQEELANLADVPLSQIGRIERGEVNPTLSTIFTLCLALNVDSKKIIEF
ncbi:helix-turn-helix domain-containing protein [Pedobacter sp. Leaf170]|uniref:helix-turn-helix domain-containing protein n=1 Tax=Pedobacter sp. Leaf170 TaxID=2876558 RepID=UPI001E363425|nr:helix-turn-helix transcriptional regulator [Pedobacter sp. Leaf170]